MGKSWLIASGKGGVGKSTIAACLGLGLAQLGQDVCIVDADIGLRDQDAILGMTDRVVYDLMDVVSKRCRLEQALLTTDVHERLTLLPAAQFARCKDLKGPDFTRVMKELKRSKDHVIIDCPAGIEHGLRSLLHDPADEVILITTPDDICMRDCERTSMVVTGKHQPRPRLIVNRLDEALIRAHEMYSAQVVSETMDLALLGEIPEDQSVYRAALTHRTAMELDCPASRAMMRIAHRMLGEEVPLPMLGTAVLPWYKRLFDRGPSALITKEVNRT